MGESIVSDNCVALDKYPGRAIFRAAPQRCADILRREKAGFRDKNAFQLQTVLMGGRGIFLFSCLLFSSVPSSVAPATVALQNVDVILVGSARNEPGSSSSCRFDAAFKRLSAPLSPDASFLVDFQYGLGYDDPLREVVVLRDRVWDGPLFPPGVVLGDVGGGGGGPVVGFKSLA